MAKTITLNAALRCTILTLEDQPREVPQAPQGWGVRAQEALNSDDEAAVMECALEIVRAHSQYRAEFDIKGWLYNLRNVLPNKRASLPA